jgi:hypothetical protein
VVYFIRAVGSNGFEFWSRVKGGRPGGIVDRVLLDRVLVGPLDKWFIEGLFGAASEPASEHLSNFKPRAS